MNESQRVLAVHPGALGDVVLFGRLLEHLPGRVTLVARGEKAELLKGLGVVEAALDFDALPMAEIFSDTPLEDGVLPERLGEHDVLISCFADGASAAGQRLAGAAQAERASFLPIRPPEGFDAHLLDLWADLLGTDPPANNAPAWSVTPSIRRLASEKLSAVGQVVFARPVLLHPGSGSAEKNWPVERFAEVARQLVSIGRAVWWLLGPVERERGFAEALGGAPGTLLPPLGLRELAGVLSAGGAVVGNDSGVSHLAAALGAPTLAVFGPASRAVQFRPVGPRAGVLEGTSLADVTAADVLDALQQQQA
jgi:ADP-heptose:LPS heptosyltransferase